MSLCCKNCTYPYHFLLGRSFPAVPTLSLWTFVRHLLYDHSLLKAVWTNMRAAFLSSTISHQAVIGLHFCSRIYCMPDNRLSWLASDKEPMLWGTWTIPLFDRTGFFIPSLFFFLSSLVHKVLFTCATRLCLTLFYLDELFVDFNQSYQAHLKWIYRPLSKLFYTFHTRPIQNTKPRSYRHTTKKMKKQNATWPTKK